MAAHQKPWRFVSITEKPETESFDCGIPALNDYLNKYAGQNHRKGLGSTYVLVPEGKPIAAGYYTLSMAQVDLNFLPETYRKGLPKYPVPAVRLARLARDLKWKGQKLGEILLMDAIHRSIAAVQSVAAKYMIVDVKNEEAEKFYLRYGFRHFEGETASLVIAIETLKRTFETTDH